MRKRWWIVALVVLGLGGWWSFGRGDDEEPLEAKARASAPIERGDLEVVVRASATVEPFFEVEVKSKASGEVRAFPLQPGDRVERGELIVELDPEAEERNVRRARSEVASNEAALAAAKAELERREKESALKLLEAKAQRESAEAGLRAAKAARERAEGLFQRGLLSPEALDQARVEEASAASVLAAAKAALGRAKLDPFAIEIQRQEVALRSIALERSRIALEEALQRLAETKIRAPIDGVLLDKAVERGQIIASGLSGFNGGTTLCTIADTSVTLVVASVDEADIGQVRAGQPVRVSCDAYRHTTWPGVVRRVLPRGKEESNVVLFEVRIEVRGEGRERLLPGMTANVDIVVDEERGALLVPNRALSYRDGVLGVETLERGWVPIERGITDGKYTVAKGGVHEGEKVVLGTVRKREESRSWFLGSRRSKRGRKR